MMDEVVDTDCRMFQFGVFEVLAADLDVVIGQTASAETEILLRVPDGNIASEFFFQDSAIVHDFPVEIEETGGFAVSVEGVDVDGVSTAAFQKLESVIPPRDGTENPDGRVDLPDHLAGNLIIAGDFLRRHGRQIFLLSLLIFPEFRFVEEFDSLNGSLERGNRFPDLLGKLAFQFRSESLGDGEFPACVLQFRKTENV